ncbi:type II toxin-antitoxin system RelE/ParE family toxin [Virgibacillus siamensis]|uniref:Type II toxin-antitoxin system RelE/ParE family toxin n=1 Tax=Virgibacillus siamensis TaxID=480071 RepID=A0ABP3R8W0_9BACI
MKAYHLVITEPAETDLKEIADYIAKELLEPTVAKQLIAKISESIFELERIPKRHALVDDERLASQGIRKLLVDNYIVFYMASEKDTSVYIIRILYGRRNWISML